jgi:hypothetical protein
MIDETADAIILRWPKAQQAAAQPKKPTWRECLNWLAFPLWLARLVAEMTGWLAILGFLTQR